MAEGPTRWFGTARGATPIIRARRWWCGCSWVVEVTWGIETAFYMVKPRFARSKNRVQHVFNEIWAVEEVMGKRRMEDGGLRMAVTRTNEKK